jgi:hypothetical protein
MAIGRLGGGADPVQGTLFSPGAVPDQRNGSKNKLQAGDRAVHDWYRFVLSYPPHLVREYLRRFESGHGGLVLDPFCGTGTTPVECKKLGVGSIGIEGGAAADFAS